MPEKREYFSVRPSNTQSNDEPSDVARVLLLGTALNQLATGQVEDLAERRLLHQTAFTHAESILTASMLGRVRAAVAIDTLKPATAERIRAYLGDTETVLYERRREA